MSTPRTGVALLFVAALLVACSVAEARLEVRVLAHVPSPGYPANALVARDGTIYAGTFKSFSGSSDNGPSKVFAFSPAGRLLRSYTVKGQTPGAAHGVQVAAVDREGVLYLLDQDPARVIRLDPRTGSQSTWATFRSVPGCSGRPNGACTLGSGGNPAEPDFAAWGPDGSLYVTDYMQSLVWRVPPDGGTASVWLTDARFNAPIVGPAGIQLLGDHRTLMLSTGGGGADVTTGKLYKLAIGPDGRPGTLHQIWESAPLEAPDGFAVARSGDVYVALVGPSANAVVEVSPSGHEIARVPANPVANAAMAVPFDSPGSVTFDGNRVIVANQSAIANNKANMALLEIAVGERGLPLSLPPASARYRLRVRPARAAPGVRTRFRFTATMVLNGHRKPVAGAVVHFAGKVARTNKAGHAVIVAVLRQARSYRARLTLHGRKLAVTTIRALGARRGGKIG